MSQANVSFKARTVVIAGLSFATFVSTGYAILQQTEAKKQTQVASQLSRELELCKANNFVGQPPRKK